jgi:hypothetical protein
MDWLDWLCRFGLTNFQRRVLQVQVENLLLGDEVMGELFQPWHLIVLALIGFVMLAVVLPPYWMIFKKAGFSPWLSLLTLIPLVK